MFADLGHFNKRAIQVIRCMYIQVKIKLKLHHICIIGVTLFFLICFAVGILLCGLPIISDHICWGDSLSDKQPCQNK